MLQTAFGSWFSRGEGWLKRIVDGRKSIRRKLQGTEQEKGSGGVFTYKNGNRTCAVAIFVWGKRRFFWCLFAQEFFADLVDIAGAHGDQEVTGLAVFQKVVFDFIEG